MKFKYVEGVFADSELNGEINFLSEKKSFLQGILSLWDGSVSDHKTDVEADNIYSKYFLGTELLAETLTIDPVVVENINKYSIAELIQYYRTTDDEFYLYEVRRRLVEKEVDWNIYIGGIILKVDAQIKYFKRLLCYSYLFDLRTHFRSLIHFSTKNMDDEAHLNTIRLSSLGINLLYFKKLHYSNEKKIR